MAWQRDKAEKTFYNMAVKKWRRKGRAGDVDVREYTLSDYAPQWPTSSDQARTLHTWDFGRHFRSKPYQLSCPFPCSIVRESWIFLGLFVFYTCCIFRQPTYLASMVNHLALLFSYYIIWLKESSTNLATLWILNCLQISLASSINLPCLRSKSYIKQEENPCYHVIP